MDMESWIAKAPKYTSFRINPIKKFDCSILQHFLEAQSKKLNTNKIPNFYMLRSDCLIIEQWPEDVSLEKTQKEVIVDAACAAAVLRGSHVYAPGVMGLPTSCRLDERVDIYGDLDGSCKRGLKLPYEGQKIYVGTGYLKMLRHDLFDNNAKPSGIAIHTLLPDSRLPVVNETLYPRGDILLQNLPSMVCGWVVDAKPGEYILDMCAAPGNKTTHLAEMSNNQAFITALDKTPNKVAKIMTNCYIQGVTCVNAFAYDSRDCHLDIVLENDNITTGPPFTTNSFDKVLLDAPCSGFGQRPQLVKQTSSMIHSYKFLQRKLFSAAVKVLKVGGKLVYSTCTVIIAENEGMVTWVLENFPCLELIPAEPLLGGPGLSDVGLNDEQRAKVQRFGPEDDPLRPVEPIYRDSIGFFIAAFRKISHP